jgi:hypothetical protein
MSNWKYTEPTPAQLRAIKEYNNAYGVNILINNKQDAHEVISAYVPKQYLEFENGYVKGTNVLFMITNIKRFTSDAYNKLVKKYIKKVKVNDDGTVTLSIIKHNNPLRDLNNLEQLNNLMDKMLTEPSFSEYEDSLGYLSPDDLEEEQQMYGNDPFWWK